MKPSNEIPAEAQQIAADVMVNRPAIVEKFNEGDFQSKLLVLALQYLALGLTEEARAHEIMSVRWQAWREAHPNDWRPATQEEIDGVMTDFDNWAESDEQNGQ
jgi:hypothetical protein